MAVDRRPASFSEMIDPLPGSIRDVALKLRSTVQAALPDAEEAIGGGGKIGMALYSIGGPHNVVCGIQPTASACKLFFHGWKGLAESGFVLEGSGKYARHWYRAFGCWIMRVART